jgi:LPXTG-site transpeptidase (sortase) family protein
VIQPLFPKDESDEEESKKDGGYLVSKQTGKRIEPFAKELKLPEPHRDPSTASAVELIRNKVEAAYAREPSTKQELSTVDTPDQTAIPLSKHQRFMQELSMSGKPLAQIHTEWHNYYAGLPDHEKHEIWHEFYEANAHNMATAYGGHLPHMPNTAAAHDSHNRAFVSRTERHLPETPHRERRSVTAIKRRLTKQVTTSSEHQERTKQRWHSLFFGFGIGFFVIIVSLFGFFNEVIIAPLIQPSRHVSSTPLIITSNDVAPTTTPEVIIPKINVEIPVIYDATINESTIEDNLEQGTIHYASTSTPGEQGNVAIFGHSSNNILNPGEYKFAFVLLHTLVPGDIFYLTYNNTIYTYSVFDKQIVPPNDVAVLNNVPGKVATATLITCDPPGTSDNRLVVWGQQISPDPSTAVPAPSKSNTTVTPTQLANDGPSLWSRLWNWL